MSASASKKKRKQLDPQGLSFREIAEQKQAEKKKKTRKNVLIVVCAVLAVLVIVYGVILLINSRYRKTVATVGDEEIILPIYNTFYMTNANNMSYYNIFKPNVALRDQPNTVDGEGGTMEDYLIRITNDSIRQNYNLYIKAMADKTFSLSDDAKQYISNSIKSMETSATNAGYPSVNDYLRANFGRGYKLSDYENYLTITTTASEYTQHLQDTFAPSESDLSTAYDASPEDFDFVFYTYSTTKAEAEKTESTENTEDDENKSSDLNTANASEPAQDAAPTYTDEAKAAAKAEAEKKQENMPEDASSTHVQKSQVANKELAEWLFDSARKEGDTTVIAQDEEGTTYVTVRFDNRETNDYNRVNGYILTIDRKVEAADAEEGSEATKAEESSEASREGSEETEKDDEKEAEPTPDEKLATLKEGLKDGMTDEEFETYVKDLKYSANVRTMDKYSSIDEINEWLFDPARKAGDTETFETEDTYYLVRFSSVQEMTYRNELVKNSLLKKLHSEISNQNELKLVMDVETIKEKANTNLTFRGNTSAS